MEGSRVIKKLPGGCRERLRQKPWHRGLPENPSEAAGLRPLLVMLEAEPFTGIPA